MPPQPVRTRRPLLSDMEHLHLRLFGNRILRSDLSQLWAVHLTFISPPSLKPAITPSAPPHIFEVYWAVSFDSARTPVMLRAFLHFVQQRGKEKNLPLFDLTWPHNHRCYSRFQISEKLFFFFSFFFTPSLNSLSLAGFRLTLHVEVFPYGCHFLTSSQHPQIFIVETAVGNSVWNSPAPDYWFLVYMQATLFYLHVGGYMTDKSICWIRNIFSSWED